jgi:hypothetical protein
MDLHKLPEGHSENFPEGYKFSWIAFDPNRESERVLFDCHFPKGPHFHIDDEVEGEPFKWTSLDAAYDLFFVKVKERFGRFILEEESQ